MTGDDFTRATCSLCGQVDTFEEPLVVCEGALVCDACAKKHGAALAEFRDAMREDLTK